MNGLPTTYTEMDSTIIQIRKIDLFNIQVAFCTTSYTIHAMTDELKPIYWAGNSKPELLSFAPNALQDTGYQLHRLQTGNQPQDWKPLSNLGKGVTGVYEIRIWDDASTFRVAYVTKFKGTVAVLHCWQKTSQATDKRDKEIVVKRSKLAKVALI